MASVAVFVGFALVAIAIGIIYAESNSSTATPPDINQPSGSVEPQGGQEQVAKISSSDLSSFASGSGWPGTSSDPVWMCCYAIAIAEGFEVHGSNPDKLNNPGDISDGSSQFGSEFHSGSNVTHFPDAATGWEWLYNKINNAITGKSAVYSPNMTWTQLAKKWAADWQNWVKNVTTALGVDPNARVGDYFNV